jgi:protein-tyrosine phosphatase
MQVTCGSLMGTFGPISQHMAEWMLEKGWVHFLATDAHSPTSRRPLMQRAFQRVSDISGEEAAVQLCCRNPKAVVAGGRIESIAPITKTKGLLAGLFRRRNAA